MLKFLLFFFAEIFITIELGGYLGGFLTIIEIIASFALGVFLLKFLKLNFIEGLMDLAKKETDKKSFIMGNVLSLIGCLFLMIPGFLSDFIGLLFQFSLMENIVLRLIGKKNIKTYYRDSNQNQDSDIIDIEIDTEIKNLK